MLTDEQLNKMAAAAAEVERLREKAMPGPWRAVYSPQCRDPHSVFGPQSGDGSSTSIVHSPWTRHGESSNMDFIAASRSDTSAANCLRLVEEVRRCHREIATLTEERNAAEAELESATQRLIDAEVA